MPDFSEFEDKAKQLASEHPDQVDEGLKRAGDLADQHTGGRFGDEIQQGEQRAEDYLGTGGQGGQGGLDQGGQDQGGQDQGGQYGQDQGGQDQGGQDQYGQDQGQGGSY
jgi:hypothetical protein